VQGRSGLAAVAAIALFATGLTSGALPVFAAEPDPEPERGRALYLEYQCWQCHGYEGQGGAAPRVASVAYPWEAFAQFVRFPNVMPAYPPGQLDDDRLRLIYTYVRSLPEPPARDQIPALRGD